MDDSIGVVYKEQVMGKEVWVQFPVKSEDGKSHLEFFKGVITRYMGSFPNDDPKERRMEFQHYVVYEDGDEHFHDLTDLEMTGQLSWKKPDNSTNVQQTNNNKNNKKNKTTTASAASLVSPSRPRNRPRSRPIYPVMMTHRAPAAVTPARRAPADDETRTGSSSSSSSSRKRPKIKSEPTNNNPENHPDIFSNQIQIERFEQWLRNTHRGQNGNLLSPRNVSQILNRVNLFIHGHGVHYKNNWPDGVFFWKGKRVDMNTDFQKMGEEAKAFEKRYGEDKGHGWLLRHPIKKLFLYKEYILEKRHERENPISV